jgi:cyanuric acid amidohydrolase
MDLFSSVANTSADGELRNCEILLFGNSDGAGGNLRIGYAVLSDVLDADAARSAVWQAVCADSCLGVEWFLDTLRLVVRILTFLV